MTFKQAKPHKGDITTYQDGNILGLKWKDKRYVLVLSTIHDSSMVSKQRRTRQAAGGVEVVQKPAVIEDYNIYMGGVDKSDQLLTPTMVSGVAQRSGGSVPSFTLLSLQW